MMMKALGEAVSDLERQAEAAIVDVPQWQGRTVRYAAAFPPVASPMQRAVDSHAWTVQAGDEVFFLKIMADDARSFVDANAAFAAASIAGALGVSPPVIWSSVPLGAAAWPMLDSDWSTARLADLLADDVMSDVVAAKRRVHDGPAFPRSRDVFALVEGYATLAKATGVALPEDHDWMLANVRDIGAAITAAGIDARPCHGDGIASNVMIGPAGQVLLVDWDEAANADPYWDLGSLMAEAFAFDTAARVALESYAGRCDEAVFARCRLYGIADDLAWATRSLVQAAKTSRVDVEFFKHAQWRFLRCRMALQDPRFEERLRAL